MGKVVTSAGFNEFVSSGKATEEIKTPPKVKPAAVAPPLEVKADKPIAEVKGEPEAESVAEEVDPEDAAETERVRVKIGKKHRAMKEAQESAAESERFAENQFHRARLAEERATQLERERDELRAKAQPKADAKPELKKPDPQKFYDDKGQFKAFEYAEELAAYSATKAVSDLEAKQAEEKRAEQTAQAEAAARARIAEATKKYPDFAEVLAASDIKTHNAVLDYLGRSKHFGEATYYLAKNPDFVGRINQMHPLEAIAEIGRLESTFEKPTQPVAAAAASKATPGAPAPIVPLNAQGAVNINTDPAKMNFKELRAYERARHKKR